MWEELGASKTLQKVIKYGVDLPLVGIPNKNEQAHAVNKMHSEELYEVVKQYEDIKAVTKLTSRQEEQTHYWVPVKQRLKEDGSIRMFSDYTQCGKGLNPHLQTPKFKPDTWKAVQELLRKENLKWAVTIDLKDYFYHLGIS